MDVLLQAQLIQVCSGASLMSMGSHTEEAACNIDMQVEIRSDRPERSLPVWPDVHAVVVCCFLHEEVDYDAGVLGDAYTASFHCPCAHRPF